MRTSTCTNQTFGRRLVALCFGLFAAQCFGQTNPGQDGWLWYHDPAPVSTAAPPPAAEQPAPAPTPTPAKLPTDEDRPFSTAWIKVNLNRLRDAAIEQPTADNVRAYLLLQRIAIDRSQKFAEVATMVTQGDPALDENARFPLATAGAQEQEEIVNQRMVDAVKNISQASGLFFFFRSDCPYCHKDLAVLRTLMLTTGIKITAISLDGPNIDDALFPNYVVDNGVGLKLGIQATPAFFLVKPPNLDSVVQIGQGYLSLTELEQRIVDQSYFKGWIDKDLYQSTRIAAPMMADGGSLSDGTGLTADDQSLITSTISRLQSTPYHPTSSTVSESN